MATSAASSPSAPAAASLAPNRTLRAARYGIPTAWPHWDGQPPFARLDLLIVFSRCAEPYGEWVRSLHPLRLPFLIYQKGAQRCAHIHREYERLPAVLDPFVRTMPHNLGRECSAYMRFVVDHYDDLPARVVFLQMASDRHLALPGYPGARLLRHLRNTSLGYLGLSKTSFEGPWQRHTHSAPASLAPSTMTPSSSRSSAARCASVKKDLPDGQLHSQP